MDLIEESITQKSNYRDAYFLKAQLLDKYGDQQEARQTLEFILKNINPNDKEVKEYINNL
jgi:GH15 family glucan-1,4-alpha-glucosidase